jgi:RNA polymerase sigma-70 factor, ECF subfamily
MDLVMSVGNSDFTEDDQMETSDAVLVSAAKLGDTDAFVELSRRHSSRVFQTTYRITRNRQDAEDALQDSLLKAFTHLSDFQEKSSFATWLTRISINSALMILRKKRVCVEISIDGSDDPDGNSEKWEPRSHTEDAESRLAREEREQLLRDAIHRLPRVIREAVELRQARDYSVREIAQALGISVAAVKSRLSRARLTLRAALVPTDSQSESY